MKPFGAIATFIGGLALTTASLEAAPPSKITLTGITTILGPAEALYQVKGVGQQQDKSYILTEGQEEDGVGVVAIDATKCVVTFKNHGVRQDIALATEPPGGEQPLLADGVTGAFAGLNPKPGDYGYVTQKSVAAPLNENQPSTTNSPAIDPSAQSAPMINGGNDIGSGPPGHGGI